VSGAVEGEFAFVGRRAHARWGESRLPLPHLTETVRPISLACVQAAAPARPRGCDGARLAKGSK